MHYFLALIGLALVFRILLNNIYNKYLEEQQVSIVVQVNGKVRDTILIAKDILNNRKVIEKIAQESFKIQKFLTGNSVKKSVYIRGKVLNFVI